MTATVAIAASAQVVTERTASSLVWPKSRQPNGTTHQNQRRSSWSTTRRDRSPESCVADWHRCNVTFGLRLPTPSATAGRAGESNVGETVAFTKKKSTEEIAADETEKERQRQEAAEHKRHQEAAKQREHLHGHPWTWRRRASARGNQVFQYSISVEPTSSHHRDGRRYNNPAERVTRQQFSTRFVARVGSRKWLVRLCEQGQESRDKFSASGQNALRLKVTS